MELETRWHGGKVTKESIPGAAGNDSSANDDWRTSLAKKLAAFNSPETLIREREALLAKVAPILAGINAQLMSSTDFHFAMTCSFLFVQKFWQEACGLGVITNETKGLQAVLHDLTTEELVDMTYALAFYFLWLVDRELIQGTLRNSQVRMNVEALYKLSPQAQDSLAASFDGDPTAVLVIKSEPLEAVTIGFPMGILPCIRRQKDLVFAFIKETANLPYDPQHGPQKLKEMIIKFSEPRTA